MIVPKGVDAHPYTLTEPRELVLRAMASSDGVELERPVAEPLPLRPQDVAEAMRWLHTHDYLDRNGLTNRGRQVAVHLSRGDRHDPRFDALKVTAPASTRGGALVIGTRVRCSCGWGGTRNEQGPADLRVPYPPHRGGEVEAGKLHAAHARYARGEADDQSPAPRRPARDPFAGAAPADEEW